ncbi:Rieske domain-containing protein-like isoform X1 [Montipora capricornis]|uniref:Rieske domain-containing protein-like isoform X1 n=1 Tax=Montipora capricornis TaxID=246305 RepID=UPI0035F1D07F
MSASFSQTTDSPITGVSVGTKQHVIEKGRMKCNVHGRDIVIFYHDGKFYAMDQQCYHAGGPLEEGDIEDIGGRWCIICPYHRQKITLDTGEGLHYSIDPYDLKKPPQLCSKGSVQRVHHVCEDGDSIFVTLSDTKDYIPSDYFYAKKVEKD